MITTIKDSKLLIWIGLHCSFCSLLRFYFQKMDVRSLKVGKSLYPEKSLHLELKTALIL